MSFLQSEFESRDRKCTTGQIDWKRPARRLIVTNFRPAPNQAIDTRFRLWYKLPLTTEYQICSYPERRRDRPDDASTTCQVGNWKLDGGDWTATRHQLSTSIFRLPRQQGAKSGRKFWKMREQSAARFVQPLLYGNCVYHGGPPATSIMRTAQLSVTQLSFFLVGPRSGLQAA